MGTRRGDEPAAVDTVALAEDRVTGQPESVVVQQEPTLLRLRGGAGVRRPPAGCSRRCARR